MTTEHYKNVSLSDISEEINSVMYKEEWKDMAGYEGMYKISSFGRVKSVSRKIPCMNGVRVTKDRIRKQFLDKQGYPKVVLSVQDKNINVSPHILTLTHFFGSKTHESLEVNHKDGIKYNAHLSNLEWVTKSENHYHSYRVLGKKGPKYWLGKTGYKNKTSKEVLCVTNNTLYGSAHEAARSLNVDFRNVSAVCLKVRKSTGGLVFKYVA